MKIKTKDLSQAFDVCNYVPANDVIESSKFVRLKVNGINLKMSLSGTLWAESNKQGTSGDGTATGYITRSMLSAFLKTASKEEVELIIDKDKVILKSGQRLEQPLPAAISGYETWKPVSTDTQTLTPSQLKFLNTALGFLPDIAGTDNVNAVYCSREAMISTDTLSLIALLDTPLLGKPFFLPPEVAKVLAHHEGKIVVEEKGTGLEMPDGFVFQVRSSDLDSFPEPVLLQWIRDARKAPCLMKLNVEKFYEALQTSEKFLDSKKKEEEVTIENTDNILTISVNTDVAGRFTRKITLHEPGQLKAPLQLQPKKILKWLAYVISLKSKNSVVEYAKITNASAFRFKDDTRLNILLTADV